jgi:hypothetical protein
MGRIVLYLLTVFHSGKIENTHLSSLISCLTRVLAKKSIKPGREKMLLLIMKVIVGLSKYLIKISDKKQS